MLRNVKIPEKNTHHIEDSCAFFVDGKSYGLGKLLISTEKITWINNQHVGVDVKYKHLGCHANTGEDTLLITYRAPIFNQPSYVDDEDESDDSDRIDLDDESMAVFDSHHLEFKPQLSERAKLLFDVVGDCMRLNEADDECKENKNYFETTGEFYIDEKGLANLTPGGQTVYNRIESMLAATETTYACSIDPEAFHEVIRFDHGEQQQIEDGQFDLDD